MQEVVTRTNDLFPGFAELLAAKATGLYSGRYGWYNMRDNEGRAAGLQKYRVFLMELHDGLVAAMAECENLEWHHLPNDTPEFVHYLQLVKWATEVMVRKEWYDNSA